MKSIRKRKIGLILLMLAVVSIATALMMYALRQNISLFYTPTQIAQGMVVPGSIIRKPGDLTVHFKITDYKHTVNVSYRGVLPDLFREGQGIVAQGELIDNQHFKASTVLAKHDEKYMPPEVRDAVNQVKSKVAT